MQVPLYKKILHYFKMWETENYDTQSKRFTLSSFTCPVLYFILSLEDHKGQETKTMVAGHH
jgi:hypothetical protein